MDNIEMIVSKVFLDILPQIEDIQSDESMDEYDKKEAAYELIISRLCEIRNLESTDKSFNLAVTKVRNIINNKDNINQIMFYLNKVVDKYKSEGTNK